METGILLATLGVLLLCGLALEWLGRHILVPRVTLLVVFGYVIGPQALDLLSGEADEWFEPVTRIALVIGATVVFEVVGPIATRYALRRAGEMGRRTAAE